MASDDKRNDQSQNDAALASKNTFEIIEDDINGGIEPEYLDIANNADGIFEQSGGNLKEFGKSFGGTSPQGNLGNISPRNNLANNAGMNSAVPNNSSGEGIGKGKNATMNSGGKMNKKSANSQNFYKEQNKMPTSSGQSPIGENGKMSKLRPGNGTKKDSTGTGGVESDTENNTSSSEEQSESQENEVREDQVQENAENQEEISEGETESASAGLISAEVKGKIKKHVFRIFLASLPQIGEGIVAVGLCLSICSIGMALSGEGGGSGDFENEGVYSVVDNFYPVYGDSTCIILEEYDNSNHEYIVSRANESDNIYSVTDGEIVYVNYKGINLNKYYDFKTKKCMCNGKICDNYNGSEVKLKFKYEDIEYIVTYSNLAKIYVSVGDKIKKGDLIGTEGDTGCVTSKRLTFKVVSENGISYNTNELLQICSNSSTNSRFCGFQNIKIDLFDCNSNYIKEIDFYAYVKNKIYQNYKDQINNIEVLKVVSIIETSKVLKQSNYKIGDTKISIKDCDYQELEIPLEYSELIDEAINKTINQVLTYNGGFVSAKVSNTCSRNEKDKNANSIYNELCLKEAINIGSDYEKLINIYYPNYVLSKNYCNDYASKSNLYHLDNNKKELETEYSEEAINKYNNILETKIQIAKYGSRAATVEAARFLSMGLKNKIPFVNNGKFFEKGINKYWYGEGLDSSGFVSWALLNGGAKISRDLNIKELVSNNTTGSIKIDSEFYKYFSKVQVGDFAYKDSRIGIIIGKTDSVLYVAEANIKEGLIVTEIKPLGISDSDYTHIYFANDYYIETGNLTSMW